jgi:hypothetical protein
MKQRAILQFITMISVTALFVAWVSPAFSQAVDAAIEGYVFDRNTLRPLSNVVVAFRHTIDNANGMETIATTTDSNGFYSIPVNGMFEGVRSDVLAECILKRGVASSTIGVDAVLRPRVYQRNIYISLPRTDTRCRTASH